MTDIKDNELEAITGGSVSSAWKLFNCASSLIVDAVFGTQSSEGFC